MADQRRYDIVVAGGGLVGTACAAVLAASPALAGSAIAIVERTPFRASDRAAGFDPRVVAVTEASRRLLASAGVWDDRVTALACPYVHMEVRDGEGTGFIEFDCGELQLPDLGHIVENSVLVEAATRRIEALDNVEFIYRDIDHITCDPVKGEPRVVAADGSEIGASLLIAADGANSLVREQCGFRLRSWDYGHSAIVATITTAGSHGRTAFQWFSTTGPLAFLPLRGRDGDLHFSSIVWSQETARAAELMSVDDAGFCQALTRASEGRLGDVLSVSRRFSFPLRQRHATDYAVPGVALVGDAAHTIHPLAGQGVNLGFADVAVLCEELARGAGRGLEPGHFATLSRYQRRRKPENLAMMAAMEGFKRLFAEELPLVRIFRNRGMRGVNGLRPLKNQQVRRAMGF